MRHYILVVLIGLFCMSCSEQTKAQKKDEKNKTEETKPIQPKGSWKVDREFDDQGNLIRYDSIYTWSSIDTLKNINPYDKDSLIKSFKSKFFMNYSDFEHDGFRNLFSKDSLFVDRFFNDSFFESDFGKDFLDIDRITQDMIARQKKFLEKYQSEFKKPEKENQLENKL